MGQLARATGLAEGAVVATVAFDASATGGGALLYLGRHVALPASPLPPWAYLALRWDSGHARRAGAKVGEAASQARWEAYIAMLAVLHWWPILSAPRRAIALVGDADGHAARGGFLQVERPRGQRLLRRDRAPLRV